jgi:hypothetical protein
MTVKETGSLKGKRKGVSNQALELVPGDNRYILTEYVDFGAL